MGKIILLIMVFIKCAFIFGMDTEHSDNKSIIKRLKQACGEFLDCEKAIEEILETPGKQQTTSEELFDLIDNAYEAEQLDAEQYNFLVNILNGDDEDEKGGFLFKVRQVLPTKKLFLAFAVPVVLHFLGVFLPNYLNCSTVYYFHSHFTRSEVIYCASYFRNNYMARFFNLFFSGPPFAY